MHTSTFFRLFPPPKLLLMNHAGLDISDDAIHCLEYGGSLSHRTVGSYTSFELPPGLIDGGDIKDEKKLAELLAGVDKKLNLSYVKVSISEEKAYLFQTDVPSTNTTAIEQNIEFKLEENVPLAASDAVFYFDLLPLSVTGGALRASVSVVPRNYIEHYMMLLRTAGIFPVAFEVVPKAIARAIMPERTDETILIVHVMARKTGIYIASGGVISFTSTIAVGAATAADGGAENYVTTLSKEINRVYAYWTSRIGNTAATIRRIVLTGRGAPQYETALMNTISGTEVPVHVANAWENAFNLDQYVPPISRDESNEYIVAAGLAMMS